MNIQTITLDISKRSAVTPVLYLRQGDKSGTQLRVNVMRDGAAFPLGGYGVRFEMRAPKDRGYYECTGSANGNVATFTIDETYAAAFPGVTDVAYVRILEGSTVIASTGNFRVVIHEDGTEGADPNGAYTNGVTEWLEDATEQLNDVSGRAEAAIEAIGDISELAVPLMSTDVRGGAKLGHGLRISAERLGVQLVDGASGDEGIVSANGDYLHALAVSGKSVQDGTPTPDNPIEVRTVGGINLLDTINVFPKPTTTYQGCTITNNGDGTYKLSGTNSVGSPWGFNSSNGSLVLPAGTYTLSCSAVTGCSDLSIIASGGATVATTYVGNSATFTLAAATEIVSWRLVVAASATIGGTFKCQLERGSTAHDFVPYGALGLKVTGKNRLQLKPQTTTLANVKVVVTSEKVTYYGTATASGGGRTFKLTNDITLPAGTYAASAKISGSGLVWYIQRSSDSAILAGADRAKTFTLAGATDVYFGINVTPSYTFNGESVYDIQLESGSTATEYAPYVDSVTPIPLNGNVLASLPDGTHDELTVDDAGHVTIKKRTDSAVYDGSNDETWTQSITRNSKYRYRIATPKTMPNATGRTDYLISKELLCDKLAEIADNGEVSTYRESMGISRRLLDTSEFWVYHEGEQLSDFLTWLSTNNLTVYYKLVAPEVIDLGYIDMPKLTEGSTIELLATIDPPIDAEWWAVGAGAVHEAVAAQSERIAALESAIAELATS